MKKLLCTLLAGALMATALVGCGSTDSKTDETKETESSAMTGAIYPITRDQVQVQEVHSQSFLKSLMLTATMQLQKQQKAHHQHQL